MSAKKLEILVVDDEAAMREVLELRLENRGFVVHLAQNGEEAEQIAAEVRPDVVVSDVALPDFSGLELLKKLKSGDRDRPVILITAYGTVDSAVEAMKDGALDFLTKPLDYTKLDAALEAARAEIERRRDSRRLAERLESGGGGLGLLIGLSKAMQEVYELLETLAATSTSAILTGESGTGKELAARTIHQLSPRAQQPFLAINAAAIAEGITESELFGHERGAFTGAIGARQGFFEMADNGTLLLDEIAEMPTAMQPKILRVLEDGKVRRLGGKREVEVDVRVLAATNRDPEAAVDEGRLREDLYYRLSVFTVELPPLRKRLSDLPLLAQHFIRGLNDKHRLTVEGTSAEALEALRGYRWPGNVRELRNAIERAVITARHGWLEAVHLPPFLRGAGGRRGRGVTVAIGSTVAEAERKLVLETLKSVGNNKTKAAKALGLDVRTIRYKLKSWEKED